ncbi:MAG: hypothetical protein RIQ60_2167 [Pseudomonadota bacterium]|jgi:O-antigen ligase
MGSPIVPLLLGVCVAWWLDTRRHPDLSPALWWVVAWFCLLGTRPLTSWVDPAGASTAYDDGSPVERIAHAALILAAIVVLLRRQLDWHMLLSGQGWLLLFFGYCALSLLWADTPLVALKRWVKDVGQVVMALLVITEVRPVEAMQAVFRRCAWLLLPISLLLIRWVPELGRTFHVGTGEMMAIGVATHKNSLGVLVLVCLVYLLWDLSASRGWRDRIQALLLTGMGLDLLVQAGSATATGCAALALVVLLGLGRPAVRRHLLVIEFTLACAAVLLWLTGGAQALLTFAVVDLFGRDPTLTTRTDVWPLLLEQVDNLLLGTGYGSFWTGDRLATLNARLGIIQAHNGYLETCLNGGLLGLGLLLAWLCAGCLGCHRQLAAGVAWARPACAVLAVLAVYNITEAAFDTTSPLWFAAVLMLWLSCSRSTPRSTKAGAGQLPRQLGILP